MTSSLTRAICALLSPGGLRARLAVFCYHQVLEDKDSLRPTEPTVEEFDADVETIGRLFNVLPLPEAVERLESRTLPPRAACITFDDGYANNHTLAAPLLERAGMPATFFVAGGAVDDGVMWNDLVIEGARSKREEWILRDLRTLCDSPMPESHRDAASLIAWILPRLKYRPLQERLEIAEAFFRKNTGREPPRLMMEREQVSDLFRRGFDIGGHTISHPILNELSDEDARDEIEGCCRWIVEVTGRTPVTFAYPNGIPHRDFGPVHSTMAREAGFRSAVSTQWGVAGPACDPLSIPRIGPWWRLGSRPSVGLVRAYGRSWADQYST